MSGKRILFYILGAFFAGTLVLLYVEYNSARHVNALITANQKLLGEFQITKNLLDVARSKVMVERKIRGFIESGDTVYLAGLRADLDQVDSAKASLLYISDDAHTGALIRRLDTVVRRKVDLFNKVLEAFEQHGVRAAEDSINANLPDWVSYDIETSIRKITEAREHQLAVITASLQRSGEKALEFSYIAIGIVLVSGALLFWYIIHIIQRLIKSERKVRETARIKENFLANMSHEIRTPMNGILGFTQLLAQKDNLDKDARHYVQTIQHSGENLLAIVNDILDISKIEAGMMRIEKFPFSLRELVHSVEMMMRVKANAKTVTLHTEIDDDIPDILEGDAIRLTQILTNLLSNALKFTSQGSIHIKISAAAISGPEVSLLIDISDTGIGIDAHKLRQIFDRFQQADDTITRQYGGTGLGLSIVKDLVELQGGSIDVESTVGQGTVFHIIMPYTVSTLQNGTVRASLETAQQEGSLSDVRVLITEDNEANQSLLMHIFRNWGIRFDIANNGIEAVEKLKKAKYDLVLMDIQMPLMDGYTATKKIRNELRSDIPIVAMTAHAFPGEREKCMSNGMNDYISKPVKQEYLAEMISRFTKFVHQEPGEPVRIPEPSNNFQYIDLSYLMEVSAGNRDYEKDVTRKFLEAVPKALSALHESLDTGDYNNMQRIAHNLKTTVSIMGLNGILNPLLNDLEQGDVDPQRYRKVLVEIEDIYRKAEIEANSFLQSFD